MTTAILMTLPQLKAATPAAFAKKPDKRVSERYEFIPTTDMIAALTAAGFVPVGARNQRAYKGSGNDTTGRHVVRFRLAKTAKQALGEVIPEVIVSSSHNGRTRYTMRAGLFRLVCLNGLTVATHNFGEISVKHTKGMLAEVTAAANKIIADAITSVKAVEAMQAVKLNEKEQHAFAKKALGIRFREDKGETPPVTAEAVLGVRRKEDEGASVWQVFNRVQENLVKGGLVGAAESGRRVQTRQLTSTGRDAQVNYDLWQLALTSVRKAGKMPVLKSALTEKAVAVTH